MRQDGVSIVKEEKSLLFSPSHVVQTAHLPLQDTAAQEQASFTSGFDHSLSGGGLENEIRQLKTLLGRLARDFDLRVVSPSMTPDEKGQLAIHDTMLRDRDFNRTYEHHNEPPRLPQITLNPTIAAQQKNMRK